MPVIDYAIPPARLTEAELPPPVMTTDPHTFAGHTLRVRLPAILREAIELNALRLTARGARELEDLHAELGAGRLRPLREDTADRAFWDVACAPFAGRSWPDIPWYFAEAFFYRRILEATGYFGSGPLAGVDPFGPKKAAEWIADAAPSAAERSLGVLPIGLEERIKALLLVSLWGNRTDLSYQVAAHLGRADGSRDERDNLVVDDTAAVWQRLRDGARHVALMADNAGTELLMDLALIDCLLERGVVAQVDLHLKPQPLFVSDAMAVGVIDGIRALEMGGQLCQALAGRLRSALDRGTLALVTHRHYASSLAHFQMPADLFARLGTSDLIVIKGDANYRRLLGDAAWPVTTAFAKALRYAPSAVVALRTLKGGVVIGLEETRVARLDVEDSRWRENGQRGLIQAAFSQSLVPPSWRTRLHGDTKT